MTTLLATGYIDHMKSKNIMGATGVPTTVRGNTTGE